jgi:hypothetical protein
MTLGINDTQHNYTAIMQSVITLLVTFYFVLLKVIMLNGVMLNVVMVTVMAPLFQLDLFRGLSDGSILKLKFTF